MEVLFRDMGPLQYRKPRTTNDAWVFWSQEEREGEGGGNLDPITETLTNNNNCGSVQEYLRTLLSNAVYNNVALIQFWAPTTTASSTIGGRPVLKTSNQPFALYTIERGICEYRKRCTSLEFNIFQDREKNYEDGFGSKIGLVFRDKEAAYFEDDRLADCIPKKDYCTRGSLLLPLFKPSSRCCSGVLEVIGFYTKYYHTYEIPKLAKVIFKEANFIKPPSLELQQSTEIEDINKALQGVCTTHQLPLAQIWIPCCTSTAMAYVHSPDEHCHSPYLSCSNKFSSSISQNGDAYIHYKAIEEFNLSHEHLEFSKGQGIVGKALLYQKPCFCRDVAQLPRAEYSITFATHMFKFTSCYAIWLHSTCTKNHDYVLEFYVPHWNTISGDPLTFLGLLLATVKKHLPGFKISSVGEESCVEVCEISVNYDKPNLVIIPQTFSVKPVPESFVNEKETVQNEVVGETVIDSGSNILGLEENGIDFCHSDYTIHDFLKDTSPFNLSYMEPRTGNIKWIFMSQEGEGGGDLDLVTETLINNNWENFQEYLKYILCNVKHTSWANVALVQFWAPTTTTTTTTTTTSTIGGCLVLKTSNQPFGLYGLERRICEYRKHCTSHEFIILQDEDNEDVFGSVISRVFKYKKAEYDLLGDFARKCGIGTSYFLPLLKPSGWCCSGVLEISFTFQSSFFLFDPYRLAKDIFKETNFMYPPFLKLQESTEIEEINKVLQGVCTTHRLPLAQIWIPCCTSTAMAYVDSPGERCRFPYLCCSNKFSSSISQNDDAYIHYYAIEKFNSSCKYLEFRKGQSIVGKALLYHKPFFCRDVTQLHWRYYQSNFTGCCAIWLHSTCTKNDYVLEFFLPPWDKISGDLQTYLELLLATVKKQLPGFKIGSVGEESCVEIFEISLNGDEPDSIMISQITSVQPVPESFVNEKETVQNEVVGETVIDNGSNILGLEQNGIVVCHSEKTAREELLAEAATNDEIRLTPMPESLRNENELVQQQSDDEPTMEGGVRKNELNVAIVKQTSEAVTSSERIFSRAEASEREYRTTDITLSFEDLRKHFGKKLDDAAKILEVSRSTMKRACRRHNIKKWPAPKRKKVNVRREGIEGTYKGDPPCSDPPPRPTTAGNSHKTSNSRQEQDIANVTIKATHGGHTIRFGLPFLSRKMDLVKQVTKRLPLNEGSFNIKYQDEENDWILIACDEDLEQCIGICKGKSTIKMLVEPITNQAP